MIGTWDGLFNRMAEIAEEKVMEHEHHSPLSADLCRALFVCDVRDELLLLTEDHTIDSGTRDKITNACAGVQRILEDIIAYGELSHYFDNGDSNEPTQGSKAVPPDNGGYYAGQWIRET